jgi:hypothetical protein
MMGEWIKAIAFSFLGAIATLVGVVQSDTLSEVVVRLRDGPAGHTWLSPTSLIIQSAQEGDRKSLQRRCLDQATMIKRSVFVRGVCTYSTSRTCTQDTIRWIDGEVRASLPDPEFWDFPSLLDRFSALGTRELRYRLSERSHVLNEALSNGAVDFSGKIVSFKSPPLALKLINSMDGLCGALSLYENDLVYID